jgi:hypothetical protein
MRHYVSYVLDASARQVRLSTSSLLDIKKAISRAKNLITCLVSVRVLLRPNSSLKGSTKDITVNVWCYRAFLVSKSFTSSNAGEIIYRKPCAALRAQDF